MVIENETFLAKFEPHLVVLISYQDSMTLGTGLRLSELLGLNVGDVTPDGRDVRRRVTLDPTTTKGGRRGEVFLPARLIPKLRRFLAWKRAHGESHELDAPLFDSGQAVFIGRRAT